MVKLVEIYAQMVAAMSAARKGQGLVEYVLILALISVVAIAIMTAVGGAVVTTFTSVVGAL